MSIQPPKITDEWSAALIDFITYHRGQGDSAMTVESYCRRIRLFAADHPTGPWKVTQQSIDGWLTGRKAKGWAASTVKSHRSSLRLFYRWAAGTRRVKLDPTELAHTSGPVPKVTDDPVLNAYRVTLLAAGQSNLTVKLRIGQLQRLRAVHPDLLAVTKLDLLTWFAERRDTHSENTRHSELAGFHRFYGWALEEGLVAVDPTAKLEKIRVHPPTRKIAPDDMIEQALSRANPRQRAILLLGRYGCLRRAEIAGLRLKDREGNVLHILGKGGKHRRVFLNPDLLDALMVLEREAPAAEFYFPGRDGGHLHVDSVYMAVRTLTTWNPHSLRHAGATAAYRGTRNIRAVQDMLGHSSVATTQIYVHTEDDDLEAAAMATAIARPLELAPEPEPERELAPVTTAPARPERRRAEYADLRRQAARGMRARSRR